MGWLSFDGASLLGQILKLFSKRQKIKVTNASCIIYYNSISGLGNNNISKIEVQIEFTNFSENNNFISDFSGKYYDGENWNKLQLIDAYLPPSFKLEPKNATHVKIVFHSPVNLILPIHKIDTGTIHVDLRYRLSGKSQSLFLDKPGFIELKNGYSWI